MIKKHFIIIVTLLGLFSANINAQKSLSINAILDSVKNVNPLHQKA